MSEEQPTFKVRDRRLFNADGTPRDIEREEAPEEAAAAAPAASEPSAGAVTATGGASSATAAASAEADERATGAAQSSAGAGAEDAAALRDASAQSGVLEEEIYGGEDVPGADNPTSFINFLMSIASNAAASLGMMEHPVTGQRGVDLPLAKHWIDVLGMLQQKTRGNLVPQERQIFEGLLTDLRMQYVSLTTPPAAARGFTGRDITGGK
jgi:hypothetical protein